MRLFVAVILFVVPCSTEELYPVKEICERAGMQCYDLSNQKVEKWQNNSESSTEYLLGLHHVYFETWLVVIRISKHIGASRGIEVSASGTVLFGCETEDGYKMDVVKSASFSTELFNSYLRRSFFYCEFIVSASEEHGIAEYFEEGELKITVKQAGITYPSMINAIEVYQDVTAEGTKTKCDISLLKYEKFTDVSRDSSIRPTFVWDSPICPISGMTLFVNREGTYNPIETIYCTQSAMHTFGEDGRDYYSRNPIVAACAARTCTLCSEVDDLNGQSPPEYTAADAVTCPLLRCPSHMPAIVTDRSNATYGTPVCKKFDEGDFRWTIPAPDGYSDIFFTEATCAQSVACHDVHPLNIICNSATSCSRINPWSHKVICNDDYFLAARGSKTAPWELIRSIECDSTKGTWTKIAETNEEFPLEDYEEIQCFRTQELQEDTTTTVVTTTELLTTTEPPPALTTNATTPEPTTSTTGPTSTEQPSTEAASTEQPTSTEMSPEEQNNSNVIVAVIIGVNIMVLIFSISTCYLIKRRVKTKKARIAKKSTGKKDASKLPSAPLAYASKMTSVTSSQTQTPPLPPTSNESEKKPEKQEKQEKQVIETKQDSQEVIVDPSKEKVSAEVVEKDGSFKKIAAPAQVQPPVDNEEKEDAEQKKNKVQEMLEKSVVSEKTE